MKHQADIKRSIVMNRKWLIIFIIFVLVFAAACPSNLSTPIITITAHPEPMTNVTAGSIIGSLVVEASVTERAVLSYQWFRNTTNSNIGGMAIVGEESANFTIPINLTTGTHFFFAEVTTADEVMLARSNVATVVVESSAVKAISAGPGHTIAIKTNGSRWVWGSNFSGSLGDMWWERRLIPAQIAEATNWSSKLSSTAAIRADGSLWAWGWNNWGQVGDGTTINRHMPTRVGVDYDWVSVSTRWNHTAAIRADGSLWVWGHNANGSLGDGTTTDRHAPVQIRVGAEWAYISATGHGHTLAVKTDGSLWAWGNNMNGQLGDGTTEQRNSPVRVGEANDWASVSAGGMYSVAIKRNGSLWAWGDNVHGQIGDGTMVNRNIPTRYRGRL